MRLYLHVFQFKHLVDHINGEESNKFTNTLGESVVVTVQDSEDATAELLSALSFFSLSLYRVRQKILPPEVF